MFYQYFYGRNFTTEAEQASEIFTTIGFTINWKINVLGTVFAAICIHCVYFRKGQSRY